MDNCTAIVTLLHMPRSWSARVYLKHGIGLPIHGLAGAAPTLRKDILNKARMLPHYSQIDVKDVSQVALTALS